MRIALLLIFTLISACQSAHILRKPAQEVIRWEELLDNTHYPNSSALEVWNNESSYTSSFDVDPYLLKTQVLCKDTKLRPKTPEQLHKKYYLYKIAKYDLRKLNKFDEACAIGTPKNSSLNACLKPTEAHIAIVSDLYEDSCGNNYRGFWVVRFLKKNETIHTLVAKGKSLIHKPNSDFFEEMIAGPVSEVDAKDFLFLTLERP